MWNAQLTMSEKSMTLLLPGGRELVMLFCAPGSFIMGSREDEDGRDTDERPHDVVIEKGFWLGRFLVTQAQWRSVMGTYSVRFEDPAFPMVNVSWNECIEFARRAGELVGHRLRLPTEAEWEYACRAGTTTAYSWGDALNGDCANCNGEHPCGIMESGPRIGRPSRVGSYAANGWGFADMHGNVMEWCDDWYDVAYGQSIGAASRPSFDQKRFRVLRGGSWASDARDCRSAYRDRADPDFKSQEIGFRICCDAD